MKNGRWEAATVYTVLTLGALLMGLPFYYMIVTSLKPNTEIAQPTVSLMVHQPTIQPYVDLIDAGLVLRATWNSFVIALITTVGSMFFCTLAG